MFSYMIIGYHWTWLDMIRYDWMILNYSEYDDSTWDMMVGDMMWNDCLGCTMLYCFRS